MTVLNIIHNKKVKTKGITGRPKILDKRNTSKIKRFVLSETNDNKIVTSRKIKETLNLKASLHTIRHKLNSMGFYYGFVKKN